MERDAFHKHVSAENDPLRRREAWCRYCDIIFAEIVQHGICLASEVASQRAVDPVRIHSYIVSGKSTDRAVNSLIGFFCTHTSGVSRKYDALPVLKHLLVKSTEVEHSVSLIIHILQEHARSVAACKIICNNYTFSHLSSFPCFETLFYRKRRKTVPCLLFREKYLNGLLECGRFAYIAREDDIWCLRECALIAGLPYRDSRSDLSEHICFLYCESLCADIA